MQTDPVIFQKISALRRQVRLFVMWQGFLAVSLCLGLTVIVSLGLDWTWHLPWQLRVGLLAGALLALAGVVYIYLIAPLSHPLSDEELALVLEQHYPHLQQRLISAVEISQLPHWQRFAPQLVACVLEQAAQRVACLDVQSVLNQSRRQWILRLLAVWLLSWLALFTLLPPVVWQIWLARNVCLCHVRWPRRTHLHIQGWQPDRPQTRELAHGIDLGIVVVADPAKQVPEEVQLHYCLQGQQWQIRRVVGVGHYFRTTLKCLQADLRFYVTGGDDRTPCYQVHLRYPPRIVYLQVQVRPPAYTGQAQRSVDYRCGRVEVLCDSLLLIKGRSDQPLSSGTCSLGAAQQWPLHCLAPTRFQLRLPISSATVSGDLRIALTDRHGTQRRDAVHFALVVVRDQAPKLLLQVPDISTKITPQARLPLHFKISDDLQISAAWLVYRLRNTKIPLPEQRLALTKLQYDQPLVAKPKQMGPVTGYWDLAPLKLPLQSQLEFYLEAVDHRQGRSPDGRRLIPNVGRSVPAVVLQIVSPRELMHDLLQRQQTLRRLLEQVLEQEKRLRWQLFDLKAVYARQGLHAHDITTCYQMARLQRSLALQIKELVNQVQGLLREMRYNRLGTPAFFQTMQRQIILPGRGLYQGAFLQTANQFETVASKSAVSQTAALLANSYLTVQRILRTLQAMLQALSASEAFHDIVNHLRTILRLQHELLQETKQVKIKAVRRLLGEEK